MAEGSGVGREWLRGYRAFWVYTLARFAMFAVIAFVLWLVGVPLLLAGIIAAVVSVPLSWFLLATPRQAFAATLEQRVDHRRERSRDLEARLSGDEPPAAPPAAPSAEGDGRSRAKRR